MLTMPLPIAFAVMVMEIEEFVNLSNVFLERSGYDSISFTDPIVALEYFIKNRDKINMIITDLIMPNLNEIEIAIKSNRI
jgi:DNA-binding response OmpR family regulator